MYKTIKNGNITEYHIDGKCLLTITELENGYYQTENSSYRIVGKVTPINEHLYNVEIKEHKKKDKRGYWRKNNSLLSHNTDWFSYILQEKGFIKKQIPISVD